MPGVTVGRAAVHAAGALVFYFCVVAVFVDFFPILDAFFRVAVGNGFAVNFKESSWVCHIVFEIYS